jgi:hypothetical protein
MPRRHPRTLKIMLPPETYLGLLLAARARDIPIEQLAMILLTIVVGDDLITAVLDDEVMLAQPAGQEQQAA